MLLFIWEFVATPTHFYDNAIVIRTLKVLGMDFMSKNFQITLLF